MIAVFLETENANFKKSFSLSLCGSEVGFYKELLDFYL